MITINDYGFVKIACASPELKVANPEFNTKEIINVIKTARKGGAKILILPELCITAYTCADLFFNSSLQKSALKALAEILDFSKYYQMAIVLSLPININSALYNCAAVIMQGEILGVVPKQYISNYNEFYEKRWFKSGNDCAASEITLLDRKVPFGNILFKFSDTLTMGIEVCEDLWVPVAPSSFMTLAGANLIVNVSASNELVTKSDYRGQMISTQSAKCYCAYAYSSAGMTESTTDVVFGGECMIYENGTLLASGKRFSTKSEVTFACIDTEKLNSERARNMSFSDNGTNFYRDFTVVTKELGQMDMSEFDRQLDPMPFVPSDDKKRLERCKDILNIQSSGLAKRLLHTGLKKCVVGVSGGLDSTLALLVASDTMKRLNLKNENILGITMPGLGTTDRTYNNAVELMKALGVTIKEVDIKQSSLQHMKDIGHDPSVTDITYENTQARERTQVLMDLANKNGAILVGTGDLSELALGWCTYNGDHMSMYGVNAGIPKTLVRHMVHTISTISDKNISAILTDIIDTPVSPELLPSDKNGRIAQKTEDNIGPYELHDFFLYNFLRFGFSKEKIRFMTKNAFKDKYDDETIDKWLSVFIKRFFISQFKRSCIPDGPKVGSVSLSPRGDLRMPSDADYTIFNEIKNN